jgi:sugar O-acyltransferase (sialic acid O-acetyltransferase NeuD family)
MRDVVVFGNGQIAEVVHYYLTREGGRRVAAFTVDGNYIKSEQMLGVPVVAFEDIQTCFSPAEFDMFLAIGFRHTTKLRELKFNEAHEMGYRLTSHVSPKAVVWDGFQINPNTIIMENNVIQAFSSVGRNVIMWSGNHLGHHSKIGDHCFLASHIVVSGSVTVGDRTFIGVNATIADNLKIGARNVIGAGALILSDTPDDAVFKQYGTEISKVPSFRLRSI